MKRLAVFSHFDHQNIVDDYVIYYLDALVKIGFDIVFVSNSFITSKDENRVGGFCKKVIVRENTGYDFYCYKIGVLLSGLEVDNYDQILICNDSVYGPVFDLSLVFNIMDSKQVDMWGITSSTQVSKHLQSYFIVFNKTIIKSGCLQEYFNGVKLLSNKKDIILKYEIGLTKYFFDKGFTYASFYSFPSKMKAARVIFYNKIINRAINIRNHHGREIFRELKKIIKNIIRLHALINSTDYNPSIFFWKDLLGCGGPFIKIELLRKKNMEIDPRGSILKKIMISTKYPVTIIEQHLHRTASYY